MAASPAKCGRAGVSGMNKAIILLALFLAACAPQTAQSGYVVDRQHRERYVTYSIRTSCIGGKCSTSNERDVHPEKWYLVLRNCDKHNNCAYDVLDVTREQYEFYEYGMFFPDDKPDTP